MKRFLVATSSTDNNFSKKKAIDDPDSEVEDEVLPTEANQINVSTNYLFNGEFYSIISNDGKKLIAKCVNCLKPIQGQVNSTGNFLSHIKNFEIILNLSKMHLSFEIFTGLSCIGVAGISAYYIFTRYSKSSTANEMQNIKEELEDDKNNQCFEAGDFNTPQLKSIEELYKDALLELQSKRHLAVENIKNMAFEEIKQDPSLWAAYVRGWEDRTADVHLNASLTSPRTLRQSDEKTDEKTASCKPDKPKLGPATTSSQTPEPAQRKKPLSTQQMIRKKKRDHARIEEFLAKKRAQQSGPPPPTK